MVIRARAPLRLGLAGGGTDVSPYCDLHGGYVLNATIDRYAYAIIKPQIEQTILICSSDQEIEKTFDIDFPLSFDGKLNLHIAVYNEMINRYNDGKRIPLQLMTFCDAPKGSGLGSSSTLVVAMIQAFVELLNLPLDDYMIAHLAYKIERIDCGFLGGRQDQYSATFGGFNFMEFYKDNRAVINSLRIKEWIISELETSLLLYYTGVSRDSATIINDQSNNVRLGYESTIDAMNGLKQEAIIMKECLLKGNFQGIVESMKQGWENKKKSAKTVSNEQIDKIYNTVIQAGALSGKVSGAGGGGFMMFFVPPDFRNSVIKSLLPFGGHISNCHFTNTGACSWSIK